MLQHTGALLGWSIAATERSLSVATDLRERDRKTQTEKESEREAVDITLH